MNEWMRVRRRSWFSGKEDKFYCSQSEFGVSVEPLWRRCRQGSANQWLYHCGWESFPLRNCFLHITFPAADPRCSFRTHTSRLCLAKTITICWGLNYRLLLVIQCSIQPSQLPNITESIISPFCRNWNPAMERLNNLPKSTQMVMNLSSKAGIQTQVPCPPNFTPLPFPHTACHY